MKKKLFSAMGLMSGTSMDGVDVSIIKSDGYDEVELIFDQYFEYDIDLYRQLSTLRDKIKSSEDLTKYSKELSDLERALTIFHAEKISKIALKNEIEIDLIGFHGQTIFHSPQIKITKQLGDGNLLSQLLKKPIIYDFRQADIDNNGQGAPLTPIYHRLLVNNFLNKEKDNSAQPICIVNIGGISNATIINNISNNIENDLIAYDIGPGNCLIDEWIRNNSNLKFDEDGKIAKSGKIDQLILNQAIDNFKIETYSKSLDVKEFDISFVRGLSLEDGCSTITEFTAYLIAEGIKFLNKNNSNKYLFCGGGRKNKFLIESIIRNSNLNRNNFDMIDNFELNGDYIESQAFAYLAIRSKLNLPISFPNTTRCNTPVIGGKLANNY
ncbi:anhydro-N-acetylmuramic acid kinase [Candidatus Pelagibacter communis]|uniref:anhydro-N-acetylmuramic acid kinase n=1 Tax=Pelagibacter ubique TaxID=198252 RepID=UPI00094D9AFE|nr:anhydro-N-acetylmuramic acid kinase [Candidatus Pelagibacter ubique]